MSEFDLLVEQVQNCTLCTLSEKRTLAVPGEGSLTADIMIIGEGPGYYEDQQGRPFVGPAGRLLEELLASIGLNREDVYITNMIKCRAPNNRDPLPGEIQACKPYLDRQLELIRPRVVVTLGRYSFAKFFPDEPIGKARGTPRRWNGLTIYPMYHPAAALRNGNLRSVLEKDFRELPSILASEPPEDEKSHEPAARQLGFF
jgi:uracil-DNA glycosylase family 4